MRKPWAWSVVPAVLLLGCPYLGRSEASSQSVSAFLGGTSWQLVQFRGGNRKTLVANDRTKYIVAFKADGSVSVRIDCNRGHGSWKSSGPNQIEFGPLALTRAICPPAPLNDRLAKDWTSVRSYTLKGRHLFLSLTADGGIYEFAPLAQAEGAGVVPSSATSSSTTSSASLENTYWKLTHLPDAEVNMSSRKQEPHLVLNSETHRVSGAGGCNRLTGSYKLDADQITFSQTAVTTMACVKGMDTEKSFLDALKRVQGWKVTGQRLEFFDASGNLLATFELRHMK